MIENPVRTKTVSQENTPDYKNVKLTPGDRVSDLLKRMTLEEKVAQTVCLWRQKQTALFDDKGSLDLDRFTCQFPHGVGQIARLSDTSGGLNASQMADLANTLQKFLLEHTRLGIPTIFHEECLHGLVAIDATSYPQPIGLASTFNPALIETIYTAIAEDTRSRGAHQALTPVVDVAREPRWGRVEETFGEDPFLVAQMGIAAVRGLQGDGSLKDKKRLIATLKHFAAHGQPESGSNCAPGNYSERVLRDIFFYPFRETIQKANALSIMPSYNEIDGIPSHANMWLLKDILHREWGFQGLAVSDYFAITELHQRDEATSFSVAHDKDEAALLAANAGVNIELPDGDCYPNLVRLVHDGKLKESVIDELIAPLLRYKFQMGLFEDPYVHVDPRQQEIKLEKERVLALQAAHETMVLLKNDGDLLPLRCKKGDTIAVIGPNADRRLLGGYSGKPKYYTTVLQGIREKVGTDINVLYSEGCKITVGGSWDEDTVTAPNPEDDKASIAQAVETAKKASLVILAIGDNEQTSREAWSKVHLGDRASLDLVGMQNELVRAILQTGKPVVVLLFNGRPNSMNFVQPHVPAIVECWYLGQETGRAIANVLFGDYNPGGKLPISIPRSAGHVPCFYNYKPSARRGYLFDDISALYPFGFGLSYTSFSFADATLEKSTIRKDQATTITVNVKNTGRVAGTETVQMYIRDMVSSVTRPVKELRGFKKIHLEPGESANITLDILPEHLAFTNIDMTYGVERGDFEIMVGNSSRDQDLLKTILHVD